MGKAARRKKELTREERKQPGYQADKRVRDIEIVRRAVQPLPAPEPVQDPDPPVESRHRRDTRALIALLAMAGMSMDVPYPRR